jgi:hypothetical protein
LEIVSIERRAVGAVKETDPGLALLRGSTRVTYETKLTAKLMHRCQKCSEFQIADTLIVTTAMYDPAEQLARQLETWVKDNQSLLK